MYEPLPRWATVLTAILAIASLSVIAYVWFVEIPKELEVIKQNEAFMEIK